MNTETRALSTFKQAGGSLRTSEALKAGIQPRTLYGLRDSGQIEQIERGLFRLADLPPLIDPNWFVIANKIPKGVFCLISALDFHKLTTHVPHHVYLALPNHSHRSRLTYPPIDYIWLSGDAYAKGIETHTIDGVSVHVYNKAKTVADCFKFRNKIGKDVALDALKQYLEEDHDVDELLTYAIVNRVQNVMYPYIEALSHE